jgi:hypothetical protein
MYGGADDRKDPQVSSTSLTQAEARLRATSRPALNTAQVPTKQRAVR